MIYASELDRTRARGGIKSNVASFQSIDDESDRFDGDKHLEWRTMMRLSKSGSETAVVVSQDQEDNNNIPDYKE